MVDQWHEALACPQCRQTGLARLSQSEQAKIPNVDLVTDGFKAVQTEYGPDLRCGTCDVPALP